MRERRAHRGKARRGRAVGRVLRPADEPLGVVGSVEEATVAVAEVREGDVEKSAGDVQPASLAGHLVQREQPSATSP